ncbi:hypothetical protein IV203_031764 [Nitzschia inconspicua]|uniref:Uncharacterized protein n=1 Tax=Nitzschia inconspicua TaxID=303405 RepID=A0A9K3LXS5_9STRA|nr:hypothetical protein IV203_031764 [Nitzschia inconspicua]
MHQRILPPFVVLILATSSAAFTLPTSKWNPQVGFASFRPAAEPKLMDSRIFQHMSKDENQDSSPSETSKTTSFKDIDVQFDPVPQDDNTSSGDFFTYILLAYVVFAVADSIFHFIPNEKTYVEMLKDAIVGETGNGSSL